MVRILENLRVPLPLRPRRGIGWAAVRGRGLETERSNMGTLWLAVIILVVLALFTFGVRGRIS
jgi:hypothetical protein